MAYGLTREILTIEEERLLQDVDPLTFDNLQDLQSFRPSSQSPTPIFTPADHGTAFCQQGSMTETMSTEMGRVSISEGKVPQSPERAGDNLITLTKSSETLSAFPGKGRGAFPLSSSSSNESQSATLPTNHNFATPTSPFPVQNGIKKKQSSPRKRDGKKRGVGAERALFVPPQENWNDLVSPPVGEYNRGGRSNNPARRKLLGSVSTTGLSRVQRGGSRESSTRSQPPLHYSYSTPNVVHKLGGVYSRTSPVASLYDAGLCCNSSFDSSSESGDFSLVNVEHQRKRVEATTEYGEGFKYIDTHCHLDFFFGRDQSFRSKTFQMIKRRSIDPTSPNHVLGFKGKSWSPSCEGCITNFCHPAVFMNWEREDWTEKFRGLILDNRVYFTFSCHPHFANMYTPEVHAKLEQLFEQYNTEGSGDGRQASRIDKVVAFGEMGLDYSHKNNSDKENQKEVFLKQIELAIKYKKPIVIHCRDAEEDCLKIAIENIPRDHKIHRHCFTLGMDAAKPWLETFPNLYIGLTPLVANPLSRERKDVMEVVRELDLTRIVIETDAPFFVPYYLRYSSGGRKGVGHPGMGISVAMTLAEERNVSVTDVLVQIRANTKELYGI